MKKTLLSLALLAALAGMSATEARAETVAEATTAGPHRDSPYAFAQSGRKAKLAEAEAASGAKVLGGDIAADGAWPWQVALVFAGEPVSSNSQFCGGSLVLERWVLTAAHCVHMPDRDGEWADLPPSALAVVVGTNRMDGSGDVVPVERIIRHPNYSGDQFDFDIALIKLQRAPTVPFKTVEVPDTTFGDVLRQPGVKAVVTGFGLQNGGEASPVLRQAEIQMLDPAICNAKMIDLRAEVAAKSFADAVGIFALKEDDAYAVWDDMIARAPAPLSDNMICSGTFEGGRTSCNGDSGGPLVVPLEDGTYIQAGIVSWGLTAANGKGCEETAIFSAYTDISRFIPWLNEVLSSSP